MYLTKMEEPRESGPDVNPPCFFVRLRSNVQLLEAAVKILSDHVTRGLNALSAGLTPVEGLNLR